MNVEDLGLQLLCVPPDGEWNNSLTAWSLLFVKEGIGAFRGNSTIHHLKPGEGLLLPAGIGGILRAGRQDQLNGCAFHFTPEHLTGVLSLAERLMFQRAANQARCVRHLPADGKLARRLLDLSEHPVVNDSFEGRCKLLGLIAPLLPEVRQALEGEQLISCDATVRVVRVLANVSDTDLQELSVKDLAKRCGCSRRHLNRLVNQEFGCSILTLKTRMRLDKAASLLQDPEVKIINVAMECGFNHLGSFTAKFKLRFGATPGKWREKIFKKQRTGQSQPRKAGLQRERQRIRAGQSTNKQAYATY